MVIVLENYGKAMKDKGKCVILDYVSKLKGTSSITESSFMK